jgi:hypothetical protein
LKHGDAFRRHFGIDLELARVCSLSSEEAEAHGVGHLFTDNFNNIINDPEIDIVVELIGGTTIARTVVLNALAAGSRPIRHSWLPTARRSWTPRQPRARSWPSRRRWAAAFPSSIR